MLNYRKLAGLYVHIPFCRQVCYYCDFHFTVSLKYKEELLKALEKEIMQRVDEGSCTQYSSIYFGGGTPSILSVNELATLFSVLYRYYTIDNSAEITFEANPDDIKDEFLESLKQHTPVNRLSIGVQSFSDRDLLLMNRLHTSDEAIKSIDYAKKAGFSNINIDLIYGIPGISDKTWKKNLSLFRQLDIPHLSAYHLTIEPKTVFAYYREKGQFREISEDESLRQFKSLIEFTVKAGYEHYEISNFAKPGFHSKHNLVYWTQKPYLGFGPSAHSYNGEKRRWNISNNTRYIQSIENCTNDYFEMENIDAVKAYNEYVMTSLRTMWGINMRYLKQQYGAERYQYFLQIADKFIGNGELVCENNQFYLSNKGKMMADYIIAELMIAS